MPFECSGSFNHWLEPAVRGPEVPPVKKLLRRTLIQVAPEVPECFFHREGPADLQTNPLQFPIHGFLLCIPITLVGQPQILRALERLDTLFQEIAVFTFADRVHGLLLSVAQAFQDLPGCSFIPALSHVQDALLVQVAQDCDILVTLQETLLVDSYLIFARANDFGSNLFEHRREATLGNTPWDENLEDAMIRAVRPGHIAP